jgi:diphthine-ammonia ligase
MTTTKCVHSGHHFPHVSKQYFASLLYRLTLLLGEIAGKTALVVYAVSKFPNSTSSCTLVCVKGQIAEDIEPEIDTALLDTLDESTSVRLFYRPHNDLAGMKPYSLLMRRSTNTIPDVPSLFIKQQIPITPVPCTFIAAFDRENWDYAICIIGV